MATAVILTLAVLAILWSAAWFYVPPLLRHFAAQASNAQLGRQLRLGKITFNPWTLELTIADVALAAATEAAPPQFEAARVYVNAAAESIWRLAPVVDRLEVDAPRVRVSRVAHGQYDFDDVLRRLSTANRQPKPSSGEPAHFALYNVVVKNGEVDFIDAPLHATHRIRGLDFAVPFVSSLPSQRDVEVEPHLAFTLDGNRFESGATATPFGKQGSGKATLGFERFNVAPFFGYLSKGLPLQPEGALLSADLAFAFEQRPTLALTISGTLRLDDLKLADAAAHAVLQANTVKVAIRALRPLEKRVDLSSVEIAAPRLSVARDASGKIDLLTAAGSGTAPRSAPEQAAAAAVGSSAASGAAAASAAARDAVNAAADTAGATRAAPTWKVTLASLEVRDGHLAWRDAGTTPAAELDVGALSLDAQAIAWPVTAPASFKGSGTLGSADERGSFRFSGRADLAKAAVNVGVDALPLHLARPYLDSVLAPPLAGELSAEVAIDWQQAAAGVPRLRVDAERVAVARLVLGDAKSPELSAESIEASDAHVDLAARSVRVGRLALQTPRLRIERAEDRSLNAAGWLTSPAAAASAAATSATATTAAASVPVTAANPEAAAGRPVAATNAASAAAASAASPWKLALGELSIDQGSAHLVDRAPSPPVALDIADLSLQLRGWALGATSPVPFELSAALASPAVPSAPSRSSATVESARPSPAGSVAASIEANGELSGFVGAAPSAATAAVVVKGLPLHRLYPYFDDLLNIELRSALAGFKGKLAWQAGVKAANATNVASATNVANVANVAKGPRFTLRGEASIDDFRINAMAAAAAPATAAASSGDTAASPDRAARRQPQEGRRRGVRLDGSPGRQLLAWKSLAVRDLDVAMAPGAPVRVALGETSLTDFSARIVLDENGRLNLQEVRRSGHANGAPSAADAASAAAAAPAASSASPPSPAAIVSVGPITLVNGRVNYNDRFVKPNYTADLSELNGKLGAFSSAPEPAGEAPRLADVSLTGRVEGTASLEITGKLNPLARPLALDIAAKVRDLELPPLSPYAIKYAGYGIERGKMSVDLAYLVLPNGNLTASNKVVLNQLAFGDKVEGAPASLPVKLAVALLADRNGVIDLDLPVSGSINDPQFSIGGLIWKALGGLVVKAVTAPFTLLASALGGGGGSELSTVEFAPGMAALDAAARTSLDKVAKALVERPKVTLTVTGEAAIEAERDAWKAERLNQLLRSEKRRQTIAAGGKADAEVTVSDGERPALLAEVYKRVDVAGPASASSVASASSASATAAASASSGGAAGEPTTAQIESRLLAGITVSDEAMRQLAVRRAVNVRDYLAAQDLPTSRLFLGAPKAAAHDSGWVPRAKLELKLN